MTHALHARRTFLALAGLALLVVVLRVVPMALAGHHLLRSPAVALQWHPGNPEALATRAEFASAAGDWRTAARLARAGIAADPFNGRAFRVLAEATETVTSPADTLRLMQVALARSPLDFTARYWLIARAEMAGEAAVAVPLYERLLRLDPMTGAEVFPALGKQLSLLLSAGGSVSGWFHDAPWRTEFLVHAAQTQGSDSDSDALFREARAAGGLRPREEAAWVERYVRQQNWPVAAERWRELTGRDARTHYGPSSGDFERDTGPAPFGWTLSSAPGVDVAVDMSGSNHLLRVDFLGQRSPFSHVSRLVLLPAGNYALTWRSRGEGFRSTRGLQWSVHCAGDGAANTLVLSSRHFPRTGDDQWQVNREPFEVPVGCPAQWLRLQLDARIPAETEAYGTVLLDDVGIVPVTPAAQEPSSPLSLSLQAPALSPSLPLAS